MLRMIEVVGISPEGFAEAVKAAVERVTKAGHEAHFFEVVEQRGAVRGGQLKEFQVKVKIAVEDKSLA